MKAKKSLVCLMFVPLLIGCGEAAHPDYYTVTYDLNYEGSTAIVTQYQYDSGYEGALLRRINTQYRTALVADTWSESKTGSPVFDFDANLIIKKDYTLYAIWEDGITSIWPTNDSWEAADINISIPVCHLNATTGTESIHWGTQRVLITFETSDANPLEYYAALLKTNSWAYVEGQAAGSLSDPTSTMVYSATLEGKKVKMLFEPMVTN